MNGLLLEDSGSIRSMTSAIYNIEIYPYLYFSNNSINYKCYYNIRAPSHFDIHHGKYNHFASRITNSKINGPILIFRIDNNILVTPTESEILNIIANHNCCMVS